MFWLFAILVIVFALGLALFVDLKRKKFKNNPNITTHPNAKSGDSTNYLMGDNRYTNGGG
ncbi:hypothetical protein JFL43_10415 [Viridibacillus sp. YIM B01967]|uniref:Uncharacterized protein n=1 Tax=Viridibacillus soli TaxID=2798301 RepID=A0ABS1H768_9BACL|nr:hypothetical protein [Viridibacillus soli]MBK3495257.1 hypothetical protein [Viridibacillus soli]